MDPDETDVKIMKLLASNARLSYRQMGKKIGISTNTVITRMNALQSKGIIKHFGAIYDHEKLGYDIVAIIELTISKGKLIEVEKRIAKSRNALAVYDVTGTTDAIVLAKFKTREELNKFIKEILSMEYVERTNTRVVLNTIKEDFRIL
ncbi:MAG: Lrp/AsnC family transcriptional regulator [Candidatus Hodarchaeota archaeon]